MDSNETKEEMFDSESKSTKTMLEKASSSPTSMVVEEKKSTNLLLKRSSKNVRVFSPHSTSRLESGEAKTKKLKSANTRGFSNQSNYLSTQM